MSDKITTDQVIEWLGDNALDQAVDIIADIVNDEYDVDLLADEIKEYNKGVK